MSSATAERLLRELGPEALESVNLCIEECRRLADGAAARFWTQVAAELQANPELDERGPRPANDEDVYLRRRRWALMQKVELYRHRALKAEAQAGGSETHHADMLDIAMQWFELARQYEWLAETL